MRSRPARSTLVMGARLCTGTFALTLAGCLPAETVIGEAVRPLVDEVSVTLDGAAVVPRDVVPLADGSLLVEGTVDGSDVLVLTPPAGQDGAAERIGEGGEIGAIRSVTSSGELALVLGEEGVLAISGGALFRVPIEPMLSVTEVRALAAVERDGEEGVLDWLVSTDAGLYVVRGSTARLVMAEGAPLVVDQVAPRAPGSAWVSDDEGLLRLTLAASDQPPSLERLARTGHIVALASDAEGRAWWVEDGALFSLTRDLRVIDRELPVPEGAEITGVTSIASEGEIWVHVGDESSPDARLFHFDGAVFRPVERSLAGRRVRCATGSLCVTLDADAGTLSRVRVRRSASVEGIAEGASLHEPIAVTVVAEDAGAVSSVRAEVGSVVVPVEDGALTLDPVVVGFGARTLVVTVTWSDGTLPLVVRRSFVFEPPATWTDDIEPLYRERCSDCHGAAGPSARRLDSREGWMREIDRVVPAITTGAMPLGRPRLPEESVTLVRTWAAAGFPE